MEIKPIVGEVKAQPINDNFSYVTQQIMNVSSGSPKGVYTTLSQLQSAFPTGTNGIYVVSEDGQWYFWNGTKWASGGVYQSSSLSVDAVYFDDFQDNEPVLLYKPFVDNFNRPNSTTTLGSEYIIHNDSGNPNWGIIDNQAYSPNAYVGAVTAALYDKNVMNVSVKADIVMKGGGVNFPGLILNFVDGNNFIMFRGDENTSIKVLKKESGAYQTLTQQVFNFTTGQSVNFEFKRSYNTLTLYVNRVLLISHKLSNADHAKYNGTKHGMLVKETTARVDNLSVG
ncbi:hypothetical protein [Bacillus cereus]|uniref:hypothetical protein n=1 Tax=Bacillus cereus TaxID=1396 RepID=UPI003F892329